MRQPRNDPHVLVAVALSLCFKEDDRDCHCPASIVINAVDLPHQVILTKVMVEFYCE